MRKIIALLFLSSMLFVSCSSNKTLGFAAGLMVDGDVISHSLFNTKDANISEGNIQKVLEGKLILPQKVRIAVVNLNNFQNRYNSSDYMLMQQKYTDTIVSNLRKHSRTESALIVPQMVLTSTSFAGIREAAVRMQTDLVLVYSISGASSKYKQGKTKGFRAITNTQLMVIDVRTGLVPFSSVSTKDCFIKKEKEANKGELGLRAQDLATLKTLGQVSTEINDFLSFK